MNYKVFFIVLCAMACVCLHSCSDNEDEMPSGVLPCTASYFIGEMNDSLIDIRQNSIYDYRIYPSLYVPSTTIQPVDITGWQIKMASDYHDEPWGTLYVQWGPMGMDSFEITSSKLAIEGERVPCVNLEISDKKRYSCRAENPFKLYIDEVLPNDFLASFPVVSGRMEGTLYNEEDPDDCITFKNVTFRLWYWHNL